MSEAALDRLLAVLLAAVMATGVLTLRAGSPETQWLYVLHGLLAGTLLAAAALKVKRSLPRALAKGRWRQLAVALPLTVLVFLSLVIALVWVAGGSYIQIGPWTLLAWHGTVAWVALVLVLVHLFMRGRWRLLKPGLRRMRAAASGRRLSRRTVLTGGVLASVGAVVWGSAELLDRLGSAPRRFTGSRLLPAGGIPPPTTFFGEGTPMINQASWRLRIVGAVDRPLELTLDQLQALATEERSAVLDCTGGWAMDTSWRGLSTGKLLDLAGIQPVARTVAVRSVTGWGASLSVEEARGTLLATGVAGADLPAGNGAPCRLVVPNRRGLDWVKWVSELIVA
jgi:DMSO/TMAO reductase YedYZ molybdopterin-dependent catalytic subunit